MPHSRVHLVLVVAWVACLVPTLTVWQDAIWWIGAISIYANVATHWSAYEAARRKERDGD